MELPTICPIYALLQSGLVKLYAPNLVHLLGVRCLCIISLWMVLFVRSSRLKYVF
jgi:hypothetical protein